MVQGIVSAGADVTLRTIAEGKEEDALGLAGSQLIKLRTIIESIRTQAFVLPDEAVLEPVESFMATLFTKQAEFESIINLLNIANMAWKPKAYSSAWPAIDSNNRVREIVNQPNAPESAINWYPVYQSMELLPQNVTINPYMASTILTYRDMVRHKAGELMANNQESE